MCALTWLYRQRPVIRQVHGCDLSVLFINTMIRLTMKRLMGQLCQISVKNVHANSCQRVGQSRLIRVALLLYFLWKHFRKKHACFLLNETVQSCSLHCGWQNRSFLERSQIVTQTESFWARARTRLALSPICLENSCCTVKQQWAELREDFLW